MNDGNEYEAKENPGVFCTVGSILGASDAAPSSLGDCFRRPPAVTCTPLKGQRIRPNSIAPEGLL